MATIFAVSAYTVETPDRPVIELEERPAGSPQAIRTMFYPGNRDGWEFVYPNTKRLEVAEAPAVPPAPAPVVTEVPPDLNAESVSEPAAELQVEEEAASVPAGEPVFADVTVEEPVFVAEEEYTPIFELPATAGNSLAGILTAAALLGIGLTIVVVARRRAEA